jgi:hypothetical protein
MSKEFEGQGCEKSKFANGLQIWLCSQGKKNPTTYTRQGFQDFQRSHQLTKY